MLFLMTLKQTFPNACSLLSWRWRTWQIGQLRPSIITKLYRLILVTLVWSLFPTLLTKYLTYSIPASQPRRSNDDHWHWSFHVPLWKGLLKIGTTLLLEPRKTKDIGSADSQEILRPKFIIFGGGVLKSNWTRDFWARHFEQTI